MDPRPAPPAADPDDPLVVMRDARQRFVAAFPHRCQSIAALVETIASLGAAGPVGTLRQIVHKMAGLAGTIGFPTVSKVASSLEELLDEVPHSGLNATDAAQLVIALRDRFAVEVAQPPDWMMPDSETAPSTVKILVADDDADQRAIVVSWLRKAGHAPLMVDSGDKVLAAAHGGRPSLILLDVDMPGLDGYAACRQLKSDVELASIPVIFMTARAGVDERLTGLTLGADDYLIKPVDMRELLLRVQLLLKRYGAAAQPAPHPPAVPASQPASRPATQPEPQPPPASRALLDYEAFVIAAREELSRVACSLAIVRPWPESLAETVQMFAGNVRRRDLMASYGQNLLLLLLPELTAAAACRRIDEILGGLAERGAGKAHAGVAATAVPGEKSVEELLAEADEGLLEARYTGQRVAVKSVARSDAAPAASTSATVVVADDDPEVSRIADAQMRAAGYQTIMAFDGLQAVKIVQENKVDVLVLDLMMPKLTGFDVLGRIRELPPPRPRVIVLSARGREDDVTRAFELGADDYLTKPFSPQELQARITRLLR